MEMKQEMKMELFRNGNGIMEIKKVIMPSTYRGMRWRRSAKFSLAQGQGTVLLNIRTALWSWTYVWDCVNLSSSNWCIAMENNLEIITSVFTLRR